MAFGGENAESYYDDGLTASKKGDLKKAIECFERAIRLDSSYAVAYHQLGKCYMRLGQAQRAVDILLQVVRKRPNLGPARLDLGLALLAAGNTRSARREFEQLYGLDPSNARALLGLAQCAFNEGDWVSAMQQARGALLTGGSNFSALYLAGRAAKLAGDDVTAKESLDAAEKVLQKSIEIQPDQPESHFLRGEVCFVRGELASALEHYRAADDRTDGKEPDKVYTAFGENFSQVDIWAKLGLCYQRLGKLDRAAEVGRRILSRDPNHKLGAALAELGTS
ncbi:MAG: tetratricopeptide repeat protein [Candidatus Hydrogenedentes bacterium]|nr:tetratricopeptide repeat protein [Candidatus Hydrogenedentota bacterium]